MNSNPVNGISDFFRTVVFLCGDFLNDAREFPELDAENRFIESLLESLQMAAIYDARHILSLESALIRYSAKVSGLLARYPQSNFVDALYTRINSIRDMCSQCADTVLPGRDHR